MFLSVIIPTWQESRCVVQAVSSALRIADEVIVADAGSPDETAALARRAGARVVETDRGRGPQLHAGAQLARGDVLLFMHADAQIDARARAAIELALVDPAVIGGNLRLRFAPASAWGHCFAYANDLRRRAFGIYYGDSGIFVRRGVYVALGGFRAQPILEDYEFVKRLEGHGKTAYLRDATIHASSRRFERRPLRTLLVWTLIQLLYSGGVSAHSLARWYADMR